jgi:hypothetical protein
MPAPPATFNRSISKKFRPRANAIRPENTRRTGRCAPWVRRPVAGEVDPTELRRAGGRCRPLIKSNLIKSPPRQPSSIARFGGGVARYPEDAGIFAHSTHDELYRGERVDNPTVRYEEWSKE